MVKYDEEGEMSDEGASFTQIVWKGTKEVGFGIVKSTGGVHYFVAEYLPSGNIRGQYEMNVFQLTDELIRPMVPGASLSLLTVSKPSGKKSSNIDTIFAKAKNKKLNEIGETMTFMQQDETPNEPISSFSTTTLSTRKNHIYQQTISAPETTTSRHPHMKFTSYANKVIFHVLCNIL